MGEDQEGIELFRVDSLGRVMWGTPTAITRARRTVDSSPLEFFGEQGRRRKLVLKVTLVA
jgi:hypothetical protein